MRFAPVFAASLRPRLVPDCIHDDYRPLPGVDGWELLRAGCVAGFALHRGAPVAVPDPLALLASGRHEALRAVATGLEVPDFVLRAVEEQSATAAAPLLAHSWKRFWSIAVVATVGGDKREAARRLEREEVVRAAWIWQRILGDRARARRCLEQTASDNYVAAAKVAFEVLDDVTTARRWTERAEARAEGLFELVLCAEAWIHCLDRDDDGLRCLERAAAERSEDDDVSDEVEVASAWILSFGDRDRARASLERAADLTDGCDDMCELAQAWVDVLDEPAVARSWLDRARSQAQESSEWASCADVLASKLDEPEEAMRCLQVAEERANCVFDWTSCSTSWIGSLRAPAEGERCVRTAEAAAKDAHDWAECAREWGGKLGDADAARHCLARAEAVAEWTSHWTQVAEAHLHVEDPARAEECMNEAESRAESDDDRDTCAFVRELYLEETL